MSCDFHEVSRRFMLGINVGLDVIQITISLYSWLFFLLLGLDSLAPSYSLLGLGVKPISSLNHSSREEEWCHHCFWILQISAQMRGQEGPVCRSPCLTAWLLHLILEVIREVFTGIFSSFPLCPSGTAVTTKEMEDKLPLFFFFFFLWLGGQNMTVSGKMAWLLEPKR